MCEVSFDCWSSLFVFVVGLVIASMHPMIYLCEFLPLYLLPQANLRYRCLVVNVVFPFVVLRGLISCLLCVLCRVDQIL